MPSKNSIKIYVSDGYYHLYNRGVEKRLIFLDQQDYAVFLSYLKDYLLPKDEDQLRQQLIDPQTSYRERDKILQKLRLNNFSDEVTLLAYCLMPNHFHLFIKQKSPGVIDKFMNSLGTRYSMYFNKRYRRVGSLYQDVYKAVLIESDEQLLYLTRYIHQQALSQNNQYCSYPEYCESRKTEWVKPGEILDFFSKNQPKLSYPAFVSEKGHPILLDDILATEGDA